jgi:hypothetical protein
MSKALSASTTFEALEGRVAAIETNATLEGVLHIDDANFNFSVQGSDTPSILFDAGSALQYNRTQKAFLFYIDDVLVATISTTGMQLKGTVSENAL